MSFDGVKPENFIYEFFRNSTSEDMAVDGTTPVNFDWTSPAGRVSLITRINFIAVMTAMKYGQFLGIASALTNGITIKAHDVDDSVLIDFMDGETIQTTEDFGVLAGTDAFIEPAAGPDSLPVRWTIRKAGMLMEMRPGQYLRIKIQDNLSTVAKFEALVQGFTRDA